MQIWLQTYIKSNLLTLINCVFFSHLSKFWVWYLSVWFYSRHFYKLICLPLILPKLRLTFIKKLWLYRNHKQIENISYLSNEAF